MAASTCGTFAHPLSPTSKNSGNNATANVAAMAPAAAGNTRLISSSKGGKAPAQRRNIGEADEQRDGGRNATQYDEVSQGVVADITRGNDFAR